MNIYTPYVYLIGWSQLDEYYIGSRYCNSAGGIANPTDFWTTYFTSSKTVEEYREKYGEPDIIQIHKTFVDGAAAYKYESKILQRLDAHNHPKLLNGHNNDGKFGGPQSEATNLKRSNTLKGRTRSEEHKRNLSAARKGKPSPKKGKPSPLRGRKQSAESILKRSNTLKGMVRGPHSEETKLKISNTLKERHRLVSS